MAEINSAGPAESLEKPEDEISLLDLLQVVVENLRLLVLGPLLIGLLTLGYTFTIPPTFTATTKFMPPQQQQSGAAAMLQSLGALGGLAGAAGGIKNPADQYVAFLKSRSVQDALIDRFKLLDPMKPSSATMPVTPWAPTPRSPAAKTASLPSTPATKTPPLQRNLPTRT